MVSIIAFVLSIVSVFMTLTSILRLPGFIFAIFGVVFGVVAAYQKDKKNNKDSKALEIGSIILSGASCVAFFILFLIA